MEKMIWNTDVKFDAIELIHIDTAINASILRYAEIQKKIPNLSDEYNARINELLAIKSKLTKPV